MTISAELKRIYATAPTDDYYVETLELRHPNFPGGSVFITSQLNGFAGLLEDDTPVVYSYLPFVAIPPNSEEEGNLTLQVAIDNADRRLMEQLENLAEAPTDPVSIIYRVYLVSDPDTVQNDPPLKLDILSITATQNTLAFNAGLSNLRKRPFPAQLYTTELYPGLER